MLCAQRYNCRETRYSDLAARQGEEKPVMIVITCLQAHVTATNMTLKKGSVDV